MFQSGGGWKCEGVACETNELGGLKAVRARSRESCSVHIEPGKSVTRIIKHIKSSCGDPRRRLIDDVLSYVAWRVGCSFVLLATGLCYECTSQRDGCVISAAMKYRAVGTIPIFCLFCAL